MNKFDITDIHFHDQLLNDNYKLVEKFKKSSKFMELVDKYASECELEELYLYSYTLRNTIYNGVNDYQLNKATKILFAMILAIKKLEKKKVKYGNK